MLTVQCIDDLPGFSALEPHWNELLRASASDNPFLTWEWLHAWWTHLRSSNSLHLLAVRAGDELVAVAPLRLSRGVLPGFSQLEFLGTGYAGSDYLDLIVRRGYEAESRRALGGVLQAQKLALRLSHLPPVSQAAQLAGELAGEGWMSSMADGGTCPVVPLAGHTWESYLATLGSSHRKNVRGRLKGLEGSFAMRFDQVTTEPDRHEMLTALMAFHDRRWEGRGGSTAFLTPAVRAFQHDATARALAHGWLRLYVLRLNDTPAAIMYGFLYGGRFYFYQHGFDDQYKQHGLGHVVVGLTIRAAVDEGAHEFDMLWGVEPYKFLWARDARLLQQIELFPTHIGGRIHQRAVEARRAIATLARRVHSNGESSAA